MTQEQIDGLLKKLRNEHGVEFINLGYGKSFKGLKYPDGSTKPFKGRVFGILSSISDLNINKPLCDLRGGEEDLYYFVPIASEVARLNGHLPKSNTVSRTIQL